MSRLLGHDVKCAACGAPIGSHCVSKNGMQNTVSHVSRMRDLNDWAKDAAAAFPAELEMRFVAEEVMFKGAVGQGERNSRWRRMFWLQETAQEKRAELGNPLPRKLPEMYGL